jgi:hypothetical protein
MLGTRTATTQPPATRLPRRVVRTAVVSLPATMPVADLSRQAIAVVTGNGLHAAGLLPHFTTHTHRASRLVDRWCGRTSGGPITLLDLDRMRRAALAAAASDWIVWDQVVQGSRPAQPFWYYLDRHRADPARYTLAAARSEYLAQPRILAMATHNALPHQPVPLPTAAVETFQAGYTTYLNLAWLAAVPADGFAPTTGGWMAPARGRPADQLSYLTTANAHLAGLDPATRLVAVAFHAAPGAPRRPPGNP